MFDDYVELYETTHGEFAWRRKAANHEIISHGETHPDPSKCARAAQRANPDLPAHVFGWRNPASAHLTRLVGAHPPLPAPKVDRVTVTAALDGGPELTVSLGNFEQLGYPEHFNDWWHHFVTEYRRRFPETVK